MPLFSIFCTKLAINISSKINSKNDVDNAKSLIGLKSEVPTIKLFTAGINKVT